MLLATAFPSRSNKVLDYPFMFINIKKLARLLPEQSYSAGQSSVVSLLKIHNLNLPSFSNLTGALKLHLSDF